MQLILPSDQGRVLEVNLDHCSFPEAAVSSLARRGGPGINQRLISFYSVMVSGQWLGTVAFQATHELQVCSENDLMR